MIRRILGALFLGVGLFICCGCAAVPKAQTVSYVLEAEPSRLDPAMTTALPESNVELQLFEGLTRLDENDRPQPALAASWQVSPDGTVYTFHLRDGLTWSDGEPITAQDIEYSWKRVMNPEVASENEGKSDKSGKKRVKETKKTKSRREEPEYEIARRSKRKDDWKQFFEHENDFVEPDFGEEAGWAKKKKKRK